MANYTTNLMLRTDKRNTKGEQPVILTISVSNQLKKLSTGISVHPVLWDVEEKKIIHLNLRDAKKAFKEYLKSDLMRHLPEDISKSLTDTFLNNLPLANDVKRLNDALQETKKAIEDISHRFELDGIKYSSEMVIDAYKESIKPKVKKEAPNDFIFDFLDKYIEDNEPIRAKGSLQVYKSLKTHLENYQKAKRTKIRLDKMDTAFMRSFQSFLIGWSKTNKNTKRVTTLNNITIAKQLSSIKTVLAYAKAEGVEVIGNYKEYEIKKQKLEVVALTFGEFNALIDLDLSNNERLDKVRNIFIFSCVTGLRYSDIKQLEHDHIGKTAIRITVTKTKDPLKIPLNKYSLEVLAKYKDDPKPLPPISNQRLNEYLKEVCELAEINTPIEIVRFKGAERIATIYPKWQLLSIHNGRKTFATLSLEKGMGAEEVMEIGGWSDYKSFKRYVNITENVKRKAMSKAWGDPIIMKAVNGGVGNE